MPNAPSSWKISAIVVGERFRRDLGKLDDLMDSIHAIGLLHPVVITSAGKLKRRFVGIELNSDYIKMTYERIAAGMVD